MSDLNKQLKRICWDYNRLDHEITEKQRKLDALEKERKWLANLEFIANQIVRNVPVILEAFDKDGPRQVEIAGTEVLAKVAEMLIERAEELEKSE
jgi:RNase adaptor protein for sRNA GlmZ degradation